MQWIYCNKVNQSSFAQAKLTHFNLCSHEEYFTKPRPASADELETILLREKEEQEAVDKAIKEQEEGTKKTPRSKKLNHAYLLPGVSVRVLSGPFADYTGCLKELHLKKQKVCSH